MCQDQPTQQVGRAKRRAGKKRRKGGRLARSRAAPRSVKTPRLIMAQARKRLKKNKGKSKKRR